MCLEFREYVISGFGGLGAADVMEPKKDEVDFSRKVGSLRTLSSKNVFILD
jgi:hypothetical protein